MTDSVREPVIVTTSWDDGHRLDLRLAELLDEHELTGTFYIAPHSHELAPADRLSATETARIAERFEIGAHTLTHPCLTSLPRSAAWHEIADSRKYLEEVTGRPVSAFCYPRGQFGPEHVQMVRDAGFTYARTVRRFARHIASDPLQSPTTVHAYCHLKDVPPVIRYAKLNPAKAWLLYRNWDRLAMHLFDRVLNDGGVFHLWGHSWELAENDEWQALSRVLAYIAHHPGVKYLPNSAIPSTLNGAL
jgi:peptidoglycan-N-acetylglucosamine deacetylase